MSSILFSLLLPPLLLLILIFSSLLSTCVSCSHSPVSLPISITSFPILETCSLKFAEHLSKEALCLKHDHPKLLCWKSSKDRVKNVWHPGPLGLKCNQLQTFSDLLMLDHLWSGNWIWNGLLAWNKISIFLYTPHANIIFKAPLMDGYNRSTISSCLV